jgi:hypothetical protein
MILPKVNLYIEENQDILPTDT